MAIDVMRLAREAGIEEMTHYGQPGTNYLEVGTSYDDLARFAALVLEECALHFDKTPGREVFCPAVADEIRALKPCG